MIEMGFDIALAQLLRDGGSRRLILGWSHEALYEQIAYRPPSGFF